MTRFSLVSMCAALVALAACSSSSDSSGGGEIQSEEDVQQLFEAVMPDLIEALTDLADQQFASKQGGTSSVVCPGGGRIEPNLDTGGTTLIDCSVGGVVVDGSLFLFVTSTGPSSYSASFYGGPVTVSGAYTGTFEIATATATWSVPVTDQNLYWDITIVVGEQYLFASSESSGGNGGNGEEKCANGNFLFDPGSGVECTITKEVCYHSTSNLDGCVIYNYRIGPSTDFSEFMDIFYGGDQTLCEDGVLAEFMSANHVMLFGNPNGQPPTDVPPNPEIVVTGGTYSVSNQSRNGSFVFYWPAQNNTNDCPF